MTLQECDGVIRGKRYQRTSSAAFRCRWAFLLLLLESATNAFASTATASVRDGDGCSSLRVVERVPAVVQALRDDSIIEPPPPPPQQPRRRWTTGSGSGTDETLAQRETQHTHRPLLPSEQLRTRSWTRPVLPTPHNQQHHASTAAITTGAHHHHHRRRYPPPPWAAHRYSSTGKAGISPTFTTDTDIDTDTRPKPPGSKAEATRATVSAKSSSTSYYTLTTASLIGGARADLSGSPFDTEEATGTGTSTSDETNTGRSKEHDISSLASTDDIVNETNNGYFGSGRHHTGTTGTGPGGTKHLTVTSASAFVAPSKRSPENSNSNWIQNNINYWKDAKRQLEHDLQRHLEQYTGSDTTVLAANPSTTIPPLPVISAGTAVNVNHSATTMTSPNMISSLVNVLRALGPALLAVLSYQQTSAWWRTGDNGTPAVVQPLVTRYLASFPTLYGWALLGSSVGFYLYLYFISIGHALGIGLPVLHLLIRYIRHYQVVIVNTGIHVTKSAVVKAAIGSMIPSILHSTMVILWALRLTTFLLWREYYAWPALHAKIRRVQASLPQKVLCWLVYSFLYVCMLAPCWFRLEADSAALATYATQGITASPKGGWMFLLATTVARRIPTLLGLTLQVLGLCLESLADWQKSRFKAVHARTEWCHTGLWRFSTHPNYAGEWLFWLGTVLVSLPALLAQFNGQCSGSSGNNGATLLAVRMIQGGMVIVGFWFATIVLMGAAETLDRKQKEKYGSQLSHQSAAFRDFVARFGVFGIRSHTLVHWWNMLRQLPAQNSSHAERNIPVVVVNEDDR